jgi:PKD repeat protein
MGVEHSYGAPGTYTITLVVADQNGQSGNTSTTIQIDPAPAQEETAPDTGDGGGG